MLGFQEYDVKGGYSLFWTSPYSNWALEMPISYRDIVFNCGEQMMMFFKCLALGDRKKAESVLKAKTPRRQKELGREAAGFSEAKWSREISMAVVYVATWLKATQHDQMYQHLMNDPGKEIVEASPKDEVWGIKLAADDKRCLNKAQWLGENRLGICWDWTRQFLLEPENVVYRERHERCLATVQRLFERY